MARYRRVEWYLNFIQQKKAGGEEGLKLARELAELLQIYDSTPGADYDDDRVELALGLAALETDSGVSRALVDRLRPLLATLQELLGLRLALLLAGEEVKLEVPVSYRLQIVASEFDRTGGLSNPVIGPKEKESERFVFYTEHDDAEPRIRVQVNFIMAFAGMPRQALGQCKECGRYFVVTRKGNLFCSNRCSSANIMRAKRQQLKEDPEAYARHLEEERRRAKLNYDKKREADGAAGRSNRKKTKG